MKKLQSLILLVSPHTLLMVANYFLILVLVILSGHFRPSATKKTKSEIKCSYNVPFNDVFMVKHEAENLAVKI